MAFRRWLSALLLAVALPAGAGEVAGLFESEVAVRSMSAEDRSEGIVRALEAVVRKVTGRARPAEHEGWPRLVSAAPGLVQQYSYLAAAASGESLPDETPTEAGLRLTVQFDAVALVDFLRRAQLPVWGSVRPTTLLLLAVEDGTEREVLGVDGDPAAIAALDLGREARGIPLMLPLMDIEDQQRIRFADVWGDFAAPVAEIAARYAPDMVLVGRLFREGSSWTVQWTLRGDGTEQGWSTRGERAAALFDGVGLLADRLADRFAPDPLADDRNLQLRVVGVERFADYIRVMDYLSGLSPVTAVEPLRVQRPELLVELNARASLDGLIQLTALGSVLRFEPYDPAAGQPATFRLLP